MALYIDTKYKGLSAERSYVSILPGSVSLHKDKMAFVISYRAGSEFEPFLTSSHSCDYLLDNENPFVQAYQHLKTLPEFEGCTDC